MKKWVFVLSGVLFISFDVLADDAPETSGSCAKANTGSTCTWSFDASSNTLTISGQGQMGNYVPENLATADMSSTAPWKAYINQIENIKIDEGITSIGLGAFTKAVNATNIVIPESVTSIGRRALQYTSISNISLPTNLQVLDALALADTSNLETITLPSNLTSISNWLFATSGLKEITIPSNILSIGDYAFSKTDITSIEIPPTVQSVGDYAFRECDKLTSITISDGTSIGKIFDSDLGGHLDLSRITVYCKGDNKICDAKLKAAGYDMKSRVFRNNRRIYTVDEAQKEAGEKNRVSITYR